VEFVVTEIDPEAPVAELDVLTAATLEGDGLTAIVTAVFAYAEKLTATMSPRPITAEPGTGDGVGGEVFTVTVVVAV
jgi:hypothetical protein